MSPGEISSILEDRLHFYTRILENMAEAVQAENPERLDYYSGLEEETARIILSLEKSRNVISKTTAVHVPNGEKDSLLLEERVARARSSAIAAANRNKVLLENHLQDLRARIGSTRKNPLRKDSSPADPAFIDIHL